jgi:hypothetical protein
MKKILFIAAIAATLTSCGSREKEIVLANGTIVKALNHADINYRPGSTVCIKRTETSSWIICQDGELNDTSYVHTYKKDGQSNAYVVTHKIGKIRL